MKALTIILALFLLTACEREYDPPYNHPVGEWQLFVPIVPADTIWTSYYYTFNVEGWGFMQLAGEYTIDFEWETDSKLIEVDWASGLKQLYLYSRIDSENMILAFGGDRLRLRKVYIK